MFHSMYIIYYLPKFSRKNYKLASSYNISLIVYFIQEIILLSEIC